jgi:hypothetical protein
MSADKDIKMREKKGTVSSTGSPLPCGEVNGCKVIRGGQLDLEWLADVHVQPAKLPNDTFQACVGMVCGGE